MSTIRENIIIHDRLYVQTNNAPKKICKNKQNTITNCGSYIVEEKESETITSVTSYESFDSWIEDDLLQNERIRAQANME